MDKGCEEIFGVEEKRGAYFGNARRLVGLASKDSNLWIQAFGFLILFLYYVVSELLVTIKLITVVLIFFPWQGAYITNRLID
jgi:hypothetical protein